MLEKTLGSPMSKHQILIRDEEFIISSSLGIRKTTRVKKKMERQMLQYHINTHTVMIVSLYRNVHCQIKEKPKPTILLNS